LRRVSFGELKEVLFIHTISRLSDSKSTQGTSRIGILVDVTVREYWNPIPSRGNPEHSVNDQILESRYAYFVGKNPKFGQTLLFGLESV
jgi:hypothetical protein